MLGRGFANVWPLAMLFGGLAVLAAGVLHRAAAVTAVSVGTPVAMYIVDLVGKLADPIGPLRYASAFKYYGSAVHDGIDPLAFAGMALAGGVLAGSVHTPVRSARRALQRHRHTLIWFVIWPIANNVGGNEPLALDPVNACAGTLILAAALDFARPDSFKPGGGD